MPLQPGEVSLLTLFADIHYYFNPPNSKPVHHRFDKSSYVYLYHDAINKRGRLEIANHAGTADQDAFTGFLDASNVNYSYKHPTLFTITVGQAHTPQQDTSQWHLPTNDLRNEGKYMYRLHTLDLYFWTTDDATMFLDSLKRCLQPHQVRVLDAGTSHSEHRDSMSPVVQRLEKAAITTPQAAERSNSVSTAQSSTAQQANHTPVSPMNTPPVPTTEASGNYAPMAYNPAAPAAPEPIAHREKTPPPADAASGTGLQAAAIHEHGVSGYGPQPGALQHQGSFPMHSQQQYLPGPPGQMPPGQMPPPPQQQMNRTNTNSSFPPPPPQQHTPFSAASASPASAQGQQQYGQSFAPPPPPQQQQQDPNAHLYGHQQQHPGLQRQSSIPLQYQQTPQPTSPPAHQHSFSPQPSAQYANYNPNISALQHTPSQSSPGFQPPPPQPSTGYQPGAGAAQAPSYMPSTPGTPGLQGLQGYGQPMPSPGFSPQPHQPQVPMGGYSQYNYQQGTPAAQQGGQEAYSIHQQGTPAAQQGGQDAYSIHQQMYRPTEGEAHGHGPKPGQQAQAGPGQAPGKFEGRKDRVEKGVGRFLKRLDKKL